MFKKCLMAILFICLMVMIPFPALAGDDSDGLQVSRSSTLVVAASDSSALSRAQADYVCDGTADDVEIQAAHDALPTWGKLVCLEGTYNLVNPIIWTKTGGHFECLGELRPNVATAQCALQLGTLAVEDGRPSIFIKKIYGQNQVSDGIRVVKTSGMTWVRVGSIYTCNRGIFFPQNGLTKGEVYFEYEAIEFCHYAVLFEAPYGAYNDVMEGCQFMGGFIASCDNGIVANGHTAWGYCEGAIDNAGIANSHDFIDNGDGRWKVNLKFLRETACTFQPNDFVLGRTDTVIQTGGSIQFPDNSVMISAPSSKVKRETRDMTAASGDVSYTGYGFKPRSLIIDAQYYCQYPSSSGMSDVNKSCVVDAMPYFQTHTGSSSAIIWILTAANTHQLAIVKSYDTDGFTLTWTKLGSPTGTMYFNVMAMK